MSLKKILSQIEEETKEREAFKDKLYEAMRKTTRQSKQAIFLVHKGQFKEAESLLKETKKFFAILSKTPAAHHDLVYAGIVDAAYQEYTEAHIFLRLARKNGFIEPERINVPKNSYLLGLADVVGELRRKALDSLREADVEGAEKALETMELIYNELMGMDEALHAVSELRRKTDVARRLVEITRGDVTIEMRRSSLEHSIKKLEKTMKAGKK